MSRPALSASRSIDILEFLATFSESAFTLSEISRATNINLASCYAVLTVLADRGYLTRSANQKAYQLGVSLVAIGHAAFKSVPIIGKATQSAHQLNRELGVPVLVSTFIDEEILAVVSLEDAEGRIAGMRVGERLPFIAPIGAPFLAWGSQAEVQSWIERRSSPLEPWFEEDLQRDLKQTRQRGFQIQLRSDSGPSLAALLAEMASGSHMEGYKGEMNRVIHSYDYHCRPPDVVIADELYDVMLLSAPIFDRTGRAAYNMSLGGFPQKLTGAVLTDYANRLMQACLDVMRADRFQTGQHERASA